VEASHKKAKAKFSTEAAGFTSRRARLERDADTYQGDAVGSEQQYQQLVTLISVVKARAARADTERECRSGETRLMRDFQSHEKLLAESADRADKLSSVLAVRQREIQHFAVEHAAQRRLFEGTAKLLDARATAMRDEAAAAATQGGAGLDVTRVGGANVMTIE